MRLKYFQIFATTVGGFRVWGLVRVWFWAGIFAFGVWVLKVRP